jgi:molybdopterin converting factor small subunit
MAGSTGPTEESSMAVDVKVPTILRTYTGGAKVVPGAGSTLAEVIDDVESNHSGIKDRLVEGEDLRRFINVYVNDEDVRFTGGLGTTVKDGDTVVILPAVAGGSR